LAFITGSVDEQLILQTEYLANESRISRRQLQGRLKLTDSERTSLAKIGKRLCRKALQEVAQIVRPETILSWHRQLFAKKFAGSKRRAGAEPPPNGAAVEGLVLQLSDLAWPDLHTHRSVPKSRSRDNAAGPYAHCCARRGAPAGNREAAEREQALKRTTPPAR
jgi:hypothetical protein